MNKLFSIITISYNQANYLEQCILSIIEQDIPVDYIIIDGGSTDNSVEIIKKYEDKISYWVSERDNGPANALNKGLDKAKGDYIGYINSDDYLLPGALINLKQAIEKNPNYDVYYGSGMIDDEINSAYIRVYPTKWHVGVYRSGLAVMFQQSGFIKKAILNDIYFNEGNKTNWDGELLVDLDLAGAKFFRVKKVIGAFRIHDLSISGGVQGSDGIVKYNIQRELINAKIDLHRPDMIKSKLFWLIWLFSNDTYTMFRRIINKIISSRYSIGSLK